MNLLVTEWSFISHQERRTSSSLRCRITQVRVDWQTAPSSLRPVLTVCSSFSEELVILVLQQSHSQSLPHCYRSDLRSSWWITGKTEVIMVESMVNKSRAHHKLAGESLHHHLLSGQVSSWIRREGSHDRSSRWDSGHFSTALFFWKHRFTKSGWKAQIIHDRQRGSGHVQNLLLSQ